MPPTKTFVAIMIWIAAIALTILLNIIFIRRIKRSNMQLTKGGKIAMYILMYLPVIICAVATIVILWRGR